MTSCFGTDILVYASMVANLFYKSVESLVSWEFQEEISTAALALIIVYKFPRGF